MKLSEITKGPKAYGPTVPAASFEDLPHSEQRAIIADFKEWSGGFTPDEASSEEIKTYVENTLDVKYADMRDDIEEWLNNWQDPRS